MGQWALTWWKVRHLWHRPHELALVVWPSYMAPWHLVPEFRMSALRLCLGIYRRRPTWVLRDVGTFFLRAWYAVLVLQPLHCNGNAGGWRTRLCEWLESRARREE